MEIENKECFEELNNIPSIPVELILPINEVEEIKNLNFRNDSNYGSYFANQGLCDWVQQYFEFPVETKYQILKKLLPRHTDGVDTYIWKYIYVYETGGDNVRTVWYDDIMPTAKIIGSTILKKNTWYKINVKLPHAFFNLTSPRYSVTIKKKDEV